MTNRFLSISVVAVFAGVALAGCFHAGTSTTQAGACAGKSLDKALKIGTLLPLTGALEAYGPDMERAVKLAVKQVNAAGGVNGKPVTLETADDKTDKAQAPNAFNDLVSKGVVGVVGAAASSVTGAVLNLAVQNKVVVVTPASTSPTLTEGDNQGYFWRVPPNDALQGKVLADLVYGDGVTKVAILAIDNPYGNGLAKAFEERFKAKGGTVQKTVKFAETDTIYTTQVQQAAADSPTAIVLIAYPGQGAPIMKEAHATGVTTVKGIKFYFTEGLKDAQFVSDSGKDATGKFIVAGFKGSTPEPLTTTPAAEQEATTKFNAAYKAEYASTDPGDPGLFASQSYDAAMALMLAATCAGSNDSGAAIKAQMQTVWNSPGTSVGGKDVAGALAAAKSGDVDYVGAAGNPNWDAKGDPTSGSYAFWQVKDDGTIDLYKKDIVPT